MAGIEGEIVIGRPVDVVFDYVADQRNEPHYNPRMVRAEKITDGPVGKGTVFRSAVAAGRTSRSGRTADMQIELTAYQRPALLASTTTMPRADITGTLTFEPVAGGTRMRWSWEVRPKGVPTLLGPVITRLGRRQEQRIWAGLKRRLETPKPGLYPAPHASAVDRPAERLAGLGWAGQLLLSLSLAGVPLILFVLRRFGRWGGLLVEAGCGVLFARDVAMTATGTPARLRPLPRLLLLAEMTIAGVATAAGLHAWVWRPFSRRPEHPAPSSPGRAAVRVATAAAAVTFLLHTVREAIYLSPGHGRR